MSDRKVHFSVPLHQIEYLDKHWETASRLARDGSDWLRMGLDRLRFKDRIERTAEILDRILDYDFRQQIYQERFENFVIQEQKTIRKDSPQSEPSINITESKQSIESVGTSQQEQSQKRTSTRQKNHSRGRRKKGNNKRRKHRGGHRRK